MSETIVSEALQDEDWVCPCEGCDVIRAILRKYPEPWQRHDNIVTDANGQRIDMNDPDVTSFTFRKFTQTMDPVSISEMEAMLDEEDD